jgi:hypothetical protein
MDYYIDKSNINYQDNCQDNYHDYQHYINKPKFV